jgi:hypothetical protein
VTQRTKRGLKFAAAAFFAALLVAITINAAVDSWTPQVELKNPPAAPKEAAAPAIEPASLQVPLTARPLPAPPWPEQPAAKQAQPQWNQPLFDPKFDGPGLGRNGGGAQTFTAPDFSKVLNQYAPLSQVLPPSVSPGSGPAPVSIRPIFGGKSGGVEGGALDAAGSLAGTAGSTVGGTVGGVTSGAGSLLKR